MNETQKKSISKYLSLVLRHRPQTVGIELDEAGWVGVDVLLAGCRSVGRRITREQLDEVVATNDKKRFEFSPDDLRIRASQGHSVAVDLGYEPAPPPAILYHGTADRNLESIRQKGLIRGNRHHVHLSAEPGTAENVGCRYGRPIVLEVASGQMAAAGAVFYRSTNGVWLVDHVPPEHIAFPEA